MTAITLNRCVDKVCETLREVAVLKKNPPAYSVSAT